LLGGEGFGYFDWQPTQHRSCLFPRRQTRSVA